MALKIADEFIPKIKAKHAKIFHISGNNIPYIKSMALLIYYVMVTMLHILTSTPILLSNLQNV